MHVSQTSAEQIVTKARDLFKKQGYHRTSMSDIGEASGLLKGSIYHHFPNKEAICIATMRKVHEYFTERVFSPAYDEQLSARDRMKRMAKATEDYFFQSKGGCLMGNLALETADVVPDFTPAIRKYFDDWTKALAHILRTKYSAKEAAEKAEQAVSEIQGAVMMMRLYRRRDFLVRIGKRLVALVD